MLLSQLKYFEEIFDRKLGKWNTYPVYIKINPDSKPLVCRYFPVPHINKETFRKEITRLIEIGVLTPVQQSEYGTLVFIIAKKEVTVIFLTNFRRLNRTVVKKSYHIPIIGDTMQWLEGLKFSTTLDINIGYYTIHIDTKSKDITTIVTEFGKFQYNVLLMVMLVSVDILQAKVKEILGKI